MKLKWVKNVDKDTVERIAETLEDKEQASLTKFVENNDFGAHD